MGNGGPQRPDLPQGRKQDMVTEVEEIQTKEKSEFPVIPEGTYPVKLLTIEERDGAKGPYYLWRFEATGNTGKTATVIGMSDPSFGPGAKAFKWAGVLRGRDYEPGEKIRVADLKAGKAMAVVTKIVKKDGTPGNNIVALLAAGGASPARTDEEPF